MYLLKLGGCELLYYAGEISPKKHLIGGSAGWIYKDLMDVKGVNDVEVKLPAFSSYEELKSILNESLSLYEDFKNEVLKLKP